MPAMSLACLRERAFGAHRLLLLVALASHSGMSCNCGANVAIKRAGAACKQYSVDVR